MSGLRAAIRRGWHEIRCPSGRMSSRSPFSARTRLALIRCSSLLAIALALALVTAPGRLAAAEFDLQTATIADINAAFDAGALTSEQLTRLCLARISAYEPILHAVITLNPNAIETAKALDAERKSKGPRSPLHGIPVVLKDNYNTDDLQTSGGFFGLKGSIPPQDATIVVKLKAAGAIVLAKVNLSEMAWGGAMSSLGGQSHNPHVLDATPGGSSGGTGVSIAADYAPLGYGSDTGGSIRSPSTSNGIVGLKPTYGLLSRAGIIPLALSFDTGGPMTRSVYDIAASLNVTVGVDSRDPATQRSAGKSQTDYTKFLNKDALKGARIGVARDFFGQDPEVDTIIESALSAMRAQGATLVDVKYPETILKIRADLMTTVMYGEYKAQIKDYLATLKPGFPKTHAEILALSEKVTSPTADGVVPNLGRLALYRHEEKEGLSLSDPVYLAAIHHALPFVRDTLQGLFDDNHLDAIVYPTSPRRPARLGDFAPPGVSPLAANSPTNFANLSGFPDLIVPAGFTTSGLPVGISFFGTAFSEPKILAIGYAYEQATHALRRPVNTPALPGERFSY